jgi:hypothetical protein
MDIRKPKVNRINIQKPITIVPIVPIRSQPDNNITKYKNAGKGKRVIILGNGPSLNRISCETVRKMNLMTMGVNNVHRNFWQPDFWSVNDTQKAIELQNDIRSFSGTMFSVLPKKNTLGCYVHLKNLSGQWSGDLTKGIVLGRSTVFLCLQISMWMNFDEIFVAGLDMNPHEAGDLHFYGTNRTIDPSKRKTRFINESICYDNMLNNIGSHETSKITLCVKGINPWPFAAKLNNITPEKFNEREF